MRFSVLYILITVMSCFQDQVTGQGTCNSALNTQNFIQISIPAIGSVAQAGPDYGCMTIFSRPVWSYLVSCDSMIFSLNMQSAVGPFDTIFTSIALWGPFKNKNDVCNNLTSANLVFCFDSIPYTGGVMGNWSLNVFGEPQSFYYYVVTTTSLDTSAVWNVEHLMTPGDPNQNQHPCHECNDEVSQIFNRKICLVTYDSTTQKTRVIWEKIPNAGVDGYLVLRRPSGNQLYDTVAYVSESVPSDFIDMGSHPLQYQETYCIQPVDSCGNNYHFLTDTEPSCFLQASPGGNNMVNLNWNMFAFDYFAFEPHQFIFRGTTAANMVCIDTVPQGIVAYTDISAPPGGLFYAIERRRYSPCNPNRMSQGASASNAVSNFASVTVSGVAYPELNYISIYPNPVVKILYLKIPPSLIHARISLINNSGQTVLTRFASSTTIELPINLLAHGVYTLCVDGRSKIYSRVIIAE